MQPKFLILLVDDDSSLLHVLSLAAKISFPEASFIQVHSNEEAITYIHELDHYGPKLILLDIDLGINQSGVDFAAFLRVHPEGCFLPIVMLMIDQLPTTIGLDYLAGASSFTVKPASFRDWQIYLGTLRLYWFNTVTIPPVRFHKLATGNSQLWTYAFGFRIKNTVSSNNVLNTYTMPTYSTMDFDRIGRIIRLVKLHRQGETPLAMCLSREQYLKYYLPTSDWEFWQALQAVELPYSASAVC